MMKLRTSITIRFEDADLCMAILKGIEPDNATAPQNISISARCDNNVLYIEVEGYDVKILTYRNTIDDLLEHISIAYRSIKAISPKLKDNARF